jgi:hypothetical protein
MPTVTVKFHGIVVDEYVEREEEYEGGKHELSSIRSRPLPSSGIRKLA